MEEIRRRGDGWGVELLALFRWAPFGAFWFLVRVAATAAFFFCACMALRALFLVLGVPGPGAGSVVVFYWRQALYEILWLFAPFLISLATTVFLFGVAPSPATSASNFSTICSNKTRSSSGSSQ